MLSGYAGVHVPFPIVQGLRTRGLDVVTAQERRHRRADDDVLLSQALQVRRVMPACDLEHSTRIRQPAVMLIVPCPLHGILELS